MPSNLQDAFISMAIAQGQGQEAKCILFRA